MFGDHFSFAGFHHNDTSIVRIAHVPFKHLCSWQDWTDDLDEASEYVQSQ